MELREEQLRITDYLYEKCQRAKTIYQIIQNRQNFQSSKIQCATFIQALFITQVYRQVIKVVKIIIYLLTSGLHLLTLNLLIDLSHDLTLLERSS